MRKIAATYLFTPDNQFVKNAILICEDDGTIIDIKIPDESIKEVAGLEYYSGVLVPGFVNAHCHLELSHLKGKVEKGSGFSNFLKQINQLRNYKPHNIEMLLQNIDRKMWMEGISAVGDISNTTDTIKVKKKSKIYYHTFIESFGFHPSTVEKVFKVALQLQMKFDASSLSNSIVPHSAYSVSEPLFLNIIEKAKTENWSISIHNQESNEESQFFKTGDGPIADYFKNNLNIDLSNWKPTGASSLSKILDSISEEVQLLLVHNSFMQKSDIEKLKQRRKLGNTYFVLCPNSNLYTTNQLPPVKLFQHEQLNICIGTDSLASNNKLSILSELITLQNHFPEVTLEELIRWATINGAQALGIDDRFGSFEPMKKPGINLITGIDFKTKKFTLDFKIKRLA
ncbi:MAG: amidohydrolase family protein [Prolixibacteraceae bacterium]|nr:amidohydrolase family protein [Prolixibacteraceae bacterium]